MAIWHITTLFLVDGHIFKGENCADMIVCFASFCVGTLVKQLASNLVYAAHYKTLQLESSWNGLYLLSRSHGNRKGQTCAVIVL